MSRPPGPWPHRARPALAGLAVAAVLLTGCSGGDDSPGGPPGSSGGGGASASGLAETTATVRTVSGGKLSAKAQRTMTQELTAVVDAWFDAAYLGGEYPRDDFDDAFPGFTPGAAARAQGDRQLMSNRGVGPTTYAVAATTRQVEIDTLAEKGRTSTASVQFELGMDRTGETGSVRSEVVTGHLYLTKSKGKGWQVFGYDVQRGDA
ncbi:hypothetical protein [Nocardioides litoris]|uniref:hypothetical protein n=1 Tax=Nocardioides litoris TaxID=1926648 RepID=UPI00111D249D|nr:hypothetical protein [Nocardioides litoris]